MRGFAPKGRRILVSDGLFRLPVAVKGCFCRRYWLFLASIVWRGVRFGLAVHGFAPKACRSLVSDGLFPLPVVAKAYFYPHSRPVLEPVACLGVHC